MPAIIAKDATGAGGLRSALCFALGGRRRQHRALVIGGGLGCCRWSSSVIAAAASIIQVLMQKQWVLDHWRPFTGSSDSGVV